MRTQIVGLGIVALALGCTGQSQTSLEPAAASRLTEVDNETARGGASDDGASADSFDVGEPAPAFSGLIGVDDKPHSLKDYADAKAVVIAFICNHCPVAVAYEDRLIALENDYREKGVQLIAINVNTLEADKLPAMKKRAEEKEFPFPYLYDPTQKVGRDYGAAVTPHVFVLDGQRRLAYVGAIDDSQDEAKVTEQYVRDAIDAVLAGREPETTNVQAFGCSIKYE
jgi:peroxiredoxin